MSTAIREGAWWCNYCVNKHGDKCSMDVPYYCSTVNCKYHDLGEEQVLKPHKKTSMKRLMKKVLVDTI